MLHSEQTNSVCLVLVVLWSFITLLLSYPWWNLIWFYYFLITNTTGCFRDKIITCSLLQTFLSKGMLFFVERRNKRKPGLWYVLVVLGSNIYWLTKELEKMTTSYLSSQRSVNTSVFDMVLRSECVEMIMKFPLEEINSVLALYSPALYNATIEMNVF